MQRIGWLTALLVVAYSMFVAILPLALYHEPRPPWWVLRPVAVFGLMSLPAVVGTIGAHRGQRPVVVAAGSLCLLQAFVAFSGITFGFLVPALMYMAFGVGGRWPEAERPTRTAMLAGVITIALGIGAWTAALGITEPRCYSFTVESDGSMVFVEVPATTTELYGQATIVGDGGGCGSAELTIQGLGLGALLATGAIIIASRVGGPKAAGRPESAVVTSDPASGLPPEKVSPASPPPAVWSSSSSYWIFGIGLVAFGFLAMFSIGRPFLMIGIALLVLGPLRRRPLAYWPPLVAVIAWNVAFLAVAPMSCTATRSIGGITDDADPGATVCSSLIGFDYRGTGLYNPSLEPAMQAGNLAAAVMFAIVLASLYALGRNRTPQVRTPGA